MNRRSLSIFSSDRRIKIVIAFMEILLFGGGLYLFLFHMVMPQYSQGYNASLLDKMERLESIKDSKIVLIGDSNLTFGIRSELIEKAFGMPVVNMGLHGGTGSIFNEEMAKINVHEGDIVILAQCVWANENVLSNEELVWITIENHFDLWRLIRKKDFMPMIKAYPSYVKECITHYIAGDGNTVEDSPYSRDAFNEYGDNIYSKKVKKQWEFEPDEMGVSQPSDICVNRINALNSYLKERGAVLVIAGVPIADGKYTPNKEEYYQLEKNMREKMECPVISKTDDYFYDYSFFYDSCVHLTDEGAVLRTNQLIKDLNEYLADAISRQ